MNKRNRKTNNNRQIKNKKVIRCKIKMSPVFESDTCEKFIKNESTVSDKICKYCKNSF